MTKHNDELREEVLSLVHIVGCQAQSNGFNSKEAKDVDLEWVERAEKNLTNELVQLVYSEVRQVLGRLEDKIAVHWESGTIGDGLQLAIRDERDKYSLNKEKS